MRLRVHRALCALMVPAVLAACGSSVPHDEIVAAAAGSSVVQGGPRSGGPADTTVTSIEAGQSGGLTGGSGGSDGEAQPSESSTAPGAVPCAGACDPLILGSVGNYSGVVGQGLGPAIEAIRAWVASVNSRGGLGGHPVQLIVADDGGDPGRHLSLVRELVEERGVVAFVFNAAILSGQSSVDYIDRAKVPVIGNVGSEPWFITSPMFFPSTPTGGKAVNEAFAATGARFLATKGSTKIGILSCSDGLQVCAEAQQEFPGAAAKYGLQVVYNGQASITSVDFTSQCLAARDGGAQVVVMIMDGNSNQRFARSCKSVGYTPTIELTQATLLPQHFTDPNLDGSLLYYQTAPPIDGVAALDEYRAAMQRFAPNANSITTAPLGWAAAKVLEAAAARLSDPPTSADILEGLWSLNGFDAGGLLGPLTYARDAPNSPQVCGWDVLISSGKLVSPDGGTRHCG